MENEDLDKFIDLTNKITSMTYVLYHYCLFSDGENTEISNLVEYSKMLNEKAFELYSLL